MGAPDRQPCVDMYKVHLSLNDRIYYFTTGSFSTWNGRFANVKSPESPPAAFSAMRENHSTLRAMPVHRRRETASTRSAGSLSTRHGRKKTSPSEACLFPPSPRIYPELFSVKDTTLIRNYIDKTAPGICGNTALKSNLAYVEVRLWNFMREKTKKSMG